MERTSGSNPISYPTSLAIHGVAITLLILLTRTVPPPVPHPLQTTLFLPPRDTSVYVPNSDGGGGQSMLAPASRGAVLKMAAEPLTPPLAPNRAENPKLEVEAALLGPEIALPKTTLQWGDPNGVEGGPRSGGPGDGGGFGGGHRGGIGDHDGPGFQNGVFRPGGNGGVSLPELIYRVEPEFTDAARQAKYQGTVQMTVVVDTDGRVRDPRLVKSVGMGLDEKAIEAVKQWKFKPGMKDGRPVPVYAQIQVIFRLL